MKGGLPILRWIRVDVTFEDGADGYGYGVEVKDNTMYGSTCSYEAEPSEAIDAVIKYLDELKAKVEQQEGGE